MFPLLQEQGLLCVLLFGGVGPRSDFPGWDPFQRQLEQISSLPDVEKPAALEQSVLEPWHPKASTVGASRITRIANVSQNAIGNCLGLYTY